MGEYEDNIEWYSKRFVDIKDNFLQPAKYSAQGIVAIISGDEAYVYYDNGDVFELVWRTI